MKTNQRHVHLKPLRPRPERPAGPLEGNVFGALVGTVDHVTLAAETGPKARDNHVYLWLKVNWGPHFGRYECAFNADSYQADMPVQFCLHEEEITPGDFPSVGFWNASVSYKRLGLKQADFCPVLGGTLRSLIYHYAAQCNLASAYGVTYKEGNGLHDIHMNSGEKKSGKNPNRDLEDGVLAFYRRHSTTASRRTWIFTKFASQSL